MPNQPTHKDFIVHSKPFYEFTSVRVQVEPVYLGSIEEINPGDRPNERTDFFKIKDIKRPKNSSYIAKYSPGTYDLSEYTESQLEQMIPMKDRLPLKGLILLSEFLIDRCEVQGSLLRYGLTENKEAFSMFPLLHQSLLTPGPDNGRLTEAFQEARRIRRQSPIDLEEFAELLETHLAPKLNRALIEKEKAPDPYKPEVVDSNTNKVQVRMSKGGTGKIRFYAYFNGSTYSHPELCGALGLALENNLQEFGVELEYINTEGESTGSPEEGERLKEKAEALLNSLGGETP